MKLKFWLLSAFLAFTVSAHAQQQMPQPIPIPLQTYIFDPQHPSQDAFGVLAHRLLRSRPVVFL